MTPRLAPGMQGRVSSGEPNSIREGLASRVVIGQIPPGGVFTVLNGPECPAGVRNVWYRVEYAGIVGWTAEGYDDIYWIEPLEASTQNTSESEQSLLPGQPDTAETGVTDGVLAPRVLNGHSLSIIGVAWSPSGTRLALGSSDGTISVWDAASGQELRALEGHTGGVNTVAWSPDGMWLASASDDHTVRVWNETSGQELRALKGHTDRVTSVAWSPDGMWLASASGDHTVRLWGTTSRNPLRVLAEHTEAVTSVAWSPDGTQLASGSGDGTVRVWSASSGRMLRVLAGHTEAVTSVAWSPDGTRLASGSGDGTVRLWDAASGRELRELEGHTGAVTSVAWSPHGTQLASGSYDNTLRIWDAASGRELQKLAGHTEWVLSLAWSPDGMQLASGSSDGTVRVWDVSDGAAVPIPTPPPTPRPTPTNTPDAPVTFFDSNLSGWTIKGDGGEWYAASDGLVGTVGSGIDSFFVASEIYADLIYETRFTIEEGGSTAAAGAIFGCEADPLEGCYLVRVSAANGGEIALVHFFPPRRYRQLALKNISIALHAEYTIRVAVADKAISVFLNGQHVFNTSDAEYMGGRVGLNVNSSTTRFVSASATSRGAQIGMPAAQPFALPPPQVTLNCDPVHPPLERVWNSVKARIGCPTGPAITALAAEESFERGFMFWREPIDTAHALVAYDHGSWIRYSGAPFGPDDPEFACVDAVTPAQCPPTPKRGFGKMWCNFSEIRSGLGNALTCERGFQGTMQDFDHGFMLANDQGQVFVFYHAGDWERW